MYRSLFEKIGTDGVAIHKDVSIASFTTLGIGGKAKRLITPLTLEGLGRSVAAFYQEQVDFRILGNGSNLLVSDSGVDVVLRTASLDGFVLITPQAIGQISAEVLEGVSDFSAHYPDTVPVLAYAGCSLKRLMSWAVSNGFQGLEKLCGIPASVGGAVCMNAGANGAHIADVVEGVCFAGEQGLFWRKRGQLKFCYRHLSIPEKSMVVAVLFGFKNASAKSLMATVRQIMGQRSKKQPIGKASAGCVFKNPQGMSAGLLLDRCGLKGRQRGGAEVSRMHANFIINTGQARFADVEGLMAEMRDVVFEKTSVLLEPEIVVWH